MKFHSQVSRVPAATSAQAQRHFAEQMTFETDCWDVHYTMSHGAQDFVLLDVRSAEGYRAGHVDGALHWPKAKLTNEALADYPKETLFVTYCAGPHCNGASKAALRLARLERPVKVMVGGVTGWLDEGFQLVSNDPIRAGEEE